MSDRIESVRAAILAVRVAVRAWPADGDHAIECALNAAILHIDDVSSDHAETHTRALADYSALNRCQHPLRGAAQSVVWAAVNATAARVHNAMADRCIAYASKDLARLVAA